MNSLPQIVNGERLRAMDRTNFEKLRVYQLAELLADEIWTAVSGWAPFAKQTVGVQIVRAADSVGANIAEGLGRGTILDHRRFIRTARGSLNETKHWLRRTYRRHLITADLVNKVKPLVDELSPKLNAYLRSIGSGKAGQSFNNRQPTTDN